MKPLCTSCAATEADGATFPQHVRGRPRFCGACQDQQRRDAEAQLWVDRHHAISRASYRARLRNRRASAQMRYYGANAKITVSKTGALRAMSGHG